MANLPEQTSNPQFSDPLLNRFFQSQAEKENKENGKKIIKAFYTIQTNNNTNLNYYLGRKARWNELLLWAKGSQPMSEFLNYMDVSDGNKAYVQIDMTQQRIAAQFMGTLVESMSKNKTYPCVKAIDDGSLNEKEQRLWDAIYRMYDKQNIEQLQQEAGIHLEPPNAYIPDDEISAKVYFELEDRLPKEIRFEKMLRKLQDDIKFERVLNRKGIYDMIALNMEVTKIEKLAPGEYTVRKCIPTNMVYNFFMNDTGDQEVSMIGEFYNLKVKDFRRRYLKTEENPNGLTEEQIFNLAKLSTNKNIGTFNFTWDAQWNYNTTYSTNRPYDDCSILVFDAEIDCGEDVYYVTKTDAFGKENIQEKKSVPYQQVTKDGRIINQEKPDNVSITKGNKNTWMRGVYAPYGDTMLYWGRPDVIIQPYTNVNKSLSSYTINIPNNDGDYVPSLFERILEPLREYTITKLKRKQIIALVKPSGITIDVESARNTDLGNGDSLAWEEIVRIYNQTGNVIWSSKGVNPLEKENPPISVGLQDNSVQKIIELTNVLNGIVAEIRQLIGVPQYRDGSDVGDRTSGVLQEQQNTASYNVTDFILNGHNQVWEETYQKVCLLHWNDIVKNEPESNNDLINTRFSVSVQMKSTEYQKQLLEQDIQRYSQVVDAQGNPLLTPKDAMMLREIDNDKLARWYLVATMEKNKKEAEERSQRLQQQNAEVQQQSMMAAEQMKQKALQDELLIKVKTSESESQQKKQQIFLTQIGEMRKAGVVIPPSWEAVENEILQGLQMGLFMENQQEQAAINQGMMEAQQEQQEAQGQQQQEQQQGLEQPQEQMEQQPQMQ